MSVKKTAVTTTISKKLTEMLSPTHLIVIDDSEKHRGHGGWREGGETHFKITIAADGLQGLSRVNQQRKIYKILADELKGPIHALELSVITNS